MLDPRAQAETSGFEECLLRLPAPRLAHSRCSANSPASQRGTPWVSLTPPLPEAGPTRGAFRQSQGKPRHASGLGPSAALGLSASPRLGLPAGPLGREAWKQPSAAALIPSRFQQGQSCRPAQVARQGGRAFRDYACKRSAEWVRAGAGRGPWTWRKGPVGWPGGQVEATPPRGGVPKGVWSHHPLAFPGTHGNFLSSRPLRIDHLDLVATLCQESNKRL